MGVDHRLEQHHHDDQHQHQEEEVNHQHIEHQHEHQDGTKHAHLLPIYDSIKNEQADVLTQIERLYSEFQSHSAERARTHEFPLVPFLKIFSLLLFSLRVITMFGNHFPFMLP